MAIELSNLTFTNEDDIVPASGVEEIVNISIANTLAGKDKITGNGETLRDILWFGLRTAGIYNKSNGTINTDNGDDEITGYGNMGIYNESNGTINTGNGRDKITGYASQTGSSKNNTLGVLNDGTINTDSGDDTISGYATGDYPAGVINSGSINTGNGDDNIIGDGASDGVVNARGGTINTGNGDDSIIGTSSQGSGITSLGYTDESGLSTISTINTGNGDDSIIGTTTGYGGGLGVFLSAINTGNGNDTIIGNGIYSGIFCGGDGIINTGDGNDIITASSGGIAIGGGVFGDPSSSKGTIKTGKGNDIITGLAIFNNILGIIDTDAGNDSIIYYESFTNRGNVFLGEGNDSIAADPGYYYFPYSSLENFGFIGTGDGDDLITNTAVIYNQGVIETGNGDDSIIVDKGFDGSGNVLLGNSKDYLKGFGSGNFNGGNGQDTLELTSGSYTVGISGTTVSFTKSGVIMQTSEFEKLIAGGTTYDFSSLTANQTIFVA